MPQKREQAKERRYIVFTDQHGRRWDCTWDLKGMGTTGPRNPLGWMAPVMPPSDCLLEDPETPQRFTIQYGKWIANWQASYNENEEARRRWSQAMKLPMDHPEVERMVGSAALVEIVRAAQAGNKWALGLVPLDRIPEWAEKYRDRIIHATRPADQAPVGEYPDMDEGVVTQSPIQKKPGKRAVTLDEANSLTAA